MRASRTRRHGTRPMHWSRMTASGASPCSRCIAANSLLRRRSPRRRGEAWQSGRTRSVRAMLISPIAAGTSSISTRPRISPRMAMHVAEQAAPLSVEDALSRVLALCAERTPAQETIALEQSLGRVLAQELRAPFDLPPFVNSAMDGFALRGAELPVEGERAFRLAGQVHAGAAATPECAAGECLRITTGAPLPPGADTVVIKENVRVADGEVFVRAGETAGANLRPAGEDGAAGDIVARAGDRLDYALIGALAACGAAEAAVARRPRVALFVTGDELVPPSQALGFGQIHDSNRYS